MEPVIKKDTSIAKKITFFVILSNILVGSIVMFSSIRMNQGILTKKWDALFHIIKNSSAGALGETIYKENETQMESLLKGIFSSSKNFRTLYLERKEDERHWVCSTSPAFLSHFKGRSCNEVMKKDVKKWLPTKKGRVEKIEVIAKGLDQKELIAYLNIYASLDEFTRSRNKIIKQYFLLMVLQVAVISWLISYFFQRFVTRHLKKMTVYADKLSLDKLKIKDLTLDRVEKNNDELEKLVLSFNKMKSNLQVSHDKLKDYADNLKTKVKDATAEIEDEKNNVSMLLNNMKTSVFAIGKDYKIIRPVSEYSKKIFNKDIVNQKVSDVLYYNIKKGTKEYNDLINVMSSIFDQPEIHYLSLEDDLPKIITLPDLENEKGKTLKLDYSPLLNNKGNVEKLMVMVEDVTESEGSFRDAKVDQINYHFLKEITSFKKKKDLAKKVELAIEKTFKVLDDFVSPLSDTYDYKHFNEKLKMCYVSLQIDLQDLPALKTQMDNFYEAGMHMSPHDKKINFQLKFTSITCDILDSILRYFFNLKLVYPVEYELNSQFIGKIVEKIKDIEKIFKNLFEYVFLVREVHNIDKEKLQKVVQVAKLYPEFERTIDLIHQRSKLLSFFLKLVMLDDVSLAYEDLSVLVKQMPERSRLNESIIKHNLIDPYKEVLEKTKDIDKKLGQNFSEKFVS
ncbi:methyl-accepting chemotaxis protein [Bacteriovoracales bacterium]|nr:methyl-accepting chemotaxis protein [Bacteriovoracales bacterium]